MQRKKSALHIKDTSTCSKVQNEVGGRPVENFWARIEGKHSKGHIMEGICYSPPNQEEREVNKAPFKQLNKVFKS